MCSDPGYQYTALRPLSDEAAVEIFDFLQVFMNDFENRYSNQIRRYYDSRSRHNIFQTNPAGNAHDPPF
jgi:hypothetical protein